MEKESAILSLSFFFGGGGGKKFLIRDTGNKKVKVENFYKGRLPFEKWKYFYEGHCYEESESGQLWLGTLAI